MLKPMFFGLAISVAAFAGSAQAALVDVTYTGLITGGTDVGGDFGSVGATLVGKTITVQYLFNTALGDIDTNPGENSTSGGSLFSDASPGLSASISIGGGKPVTFDGASYGSIGETSNATGSSQSHDITSAAGSDVNSFIQAGAGALPDSIVTPFSYTVSAGDFASGSFTLVDGGFASFAPTSISLSTVPLPSALPMFGAAVLGLGALQIARRRTAKAKLA